MREVVATKEEIMSFTELQQIPNLEEGLVSFHKQDTDEVGIIHAIPSNSTEEGEKYSIAGWKAIKFPLTPKNIIGSSNDTWNFGDIINDLLAVDYIIYYHNSSGDRWKILKKNEQKIHVSAILSGDSIPALIFANDEGETGIINMEMAIWKAWTNSPRFDNELAIAPSIEKLIILLNEKGYKIYTLK
jgi:hypothetical protein